MILIKKLQEVLWLKKSGTNFGAYKSMADVVR